MIFQRRQRAGRGKATGQGKFLPAWGTIVVPAFGAPYSERAVQAACRLAEGAGAGVRLVYIMEVPRALAMATPLPGEEALADQFLAQGRQFTHESCTTLSTEVIRGREAVDTLMRYLDQNEVDLVVVGSRADEVRGLPVSMARQIFSRSPCAVILDHIGEETPAPA